MPAEPTQNISLARKHRPQLFADLAGQSPVSEVLRRAVMDGNVRPAYIFAGTRGVGKTSSARILARAVNCSNLNEGEPCNQCPSCLSILSNRATDVLEIDAASYTKVEQTREVLASVAFKPASLTYRVYIIDEAHMLSKSSFNALLKTLEEPPAHALFILATTEPEKIPDTVRSRCQKYTFASPSPAVLQEVFASVLDRENASYEPEAIARIVTEANGSVRDGMTLLDQIIATHGTLTNETLASVLGQLDSTHIVAIVNGLLARDAQQVLDGLDTLFTHGASLGAVGKHIVDQINIGIRWLVTNSNAASNQPKPDNDSQWSAYGLDNAFRLSELVFQAYEKSLRSPFGPDRFTMHLLRIAALAPLSQILSGTSLPAQKNSQTAPAPAAAAPVSTSPPAPAVAPRTEPTTTTKQPTAPPMTESKSAGEAPLQTNKPVDPDAPFDPRASRSSSPSIEPQPQPSQNEGNQPSPSPTAGFDSLNAEERDTLNFKERALNDPMVRTLVDKFQGTVQSIEDLRENPQP